VRKRKGIGDRERRREEEEEEDRRKSKDGIRDKTTNGIGRISKKMYECGTLNRAHDGCGMRRARVNV